MIRSLSHGGALFLRYCLAGSAAAAVHLLVLVVCVEVLGIPPTPASATGFCIAVLVNYTLQYRWTFAATDSHGIALLKFCLVACFALTINTGIFWVAYAIVGSPYLVAQVVAIGFVVLINFFMNRQYVFVAG